MLTRTIGNFLWNDLRAWGKNNYLVHVVCSKYATANLPEPKFTSVIRIAARLKKQPRYRMRFQILLARYRESQKEQAVRGRS
jgi:hypothetical protein